MTSGRNWAGIILMLAGAFVLLASLPLFVGNYLLGLGGAFIGIIIMIFGARYGRHLD